MKEKRTVILADLGGTHLRMCHLGVDGPQEPIKISASEVNTFYDALDFYKNRFCAGTFKNSVFLLSFARKLPRDQEHLFDHKDNKWHFVPREVEDRYSMKAFDVVHDAKAMALATFSRRSGVFSPVRRQRKIDVAKQSASRSVVLLAGTGFGHSIVRNNPKEIIDTHGAHFPPAFSSDEQNDIIDRIKGIIYSKDGRHRAPKTRKTFIFENILSGQGFLNIYLALCHREHARSLYTEPAELTANADDPLVKQAGKIYSEFLGLYAHVVSMVSFAYGGVYVFGGLIERLSEAKLLDWNAFEVGYLQNMVEIVDADLRSSPIYKVEAEHTALFGLEVYYENETELWRD